MILSDRYMHIHIFVTYGHERGNHYHIATVTSPIIAFLNDRK